MDTKKAQRQGKGRTQGTAERLRAALADFDNDALTELAEEADVPFHTLRKIKSGETTDPRCSTVDRLFAAMETRAG